ncbi:hypothetical protein [Luteimonas mephitis]|uniref:hypothetical protein n=1 Tax=Luteimonas mephitis TaxID=83615 RepID=UPI003A929455
MTRTRGPHGALIIIDMVNALDFPEGPRLVRQANRAAARYMHFIHDARSCISTSSRDPHAQHP